MFVRLHPAFFVALVFVTLVALLQPTLAQLTTNNAQSACVEFGDCSTAAAGVKTETQNSPVTAPAGTPALAGYTTLDSSYISSLAAAGASAAYTGGGGGGGGATAAALTSAANTRASSTANSGGSANTAASSGLSGLGSGTGNAAASTSTALILNSAVLLAGALIGAVVLL